MYSDKVNDCPDLILELIQEAALLLTNEVALLAVEVLVDFDLVVLLIINNLYYDMVPLYPS